jgi:hypothetical protein
MHHLDVVAFRESNTWQRQLFPDDLSEGQRLAQVRTGVLSVRVRDDRVRQLAGDLRTYAGQTGSCASEADGEAVMQEMGFALDTLNERIGEILRQLDDADDVS